MGNMFRKFGVMVDCSRNAVMTLPALKKFMTILSRMGYNQLQLYMEDTYELVDEPHFGYLRGGYTCQELRELDDHAYSLGMELVPNIQTLAHMSAFVRWRKDLIDTDDILLVGDDRVYDLIERMFRSLRQCFRTESIHIGMDEAIMLGRGKYYDLHGPQNRFDILLPHLQKVCSLAEKYNFRPMMWSDMFYRIANGGKYYAASSLFDPSIRSLIPENLTLVYWDYYSHDQSRYDRMIQCHRQLSDHIVFAGGAWRWAGFAPHNDYAIRATEAAFAACWKNGIADAFLTMWGDNGAECSSFAVLPTLCYAACLAQGITQKSQIREKFKEWVGAEYEDLLLLDLPNCLEKTDKVLTPSKYFLYADCFMSIFQNLEKPEYADTYGAYARKLRSAAKRAGEYGYLFDTMAKLCAVLEIKQDICTRTRQAYESGDPEQLDEVIADYKKMIRRTEAFYEAFRHQWYSENKPHGFGPQNIRLGGLLQQMRCAQARLTDYRKGLIRDIPELTETIVPFATEHINYNNWRGASSTNLI